MDRKELLQRASKTSVSHANPMAMGNHATANSPAITTGTDAITAEAETNSADKRANVVLKVSVNPARQLHNRSQIQQKRHED